jgi:superfamily II DNA or RNA helicase
MPSESILRLKNYYENDRQSIGDQIILTCLKECTRYRRGTAFFASTSFLTYADALYHVIQNNVKIEILCSPVIRDSGLVNLLQSNITPEERIETIQRYQEDILRKALKYKENPQHKQYLRSEILAYLVANNQLIIKIAIKKSDTWPDPWPTEDDVDKHSHLYHVKRGYFVFEDEKKVVFDGSFNETQGSLQDHGEHATVYKSWRDGIEGKWAETRIKTIDRDWECENDNLLIRDLSKELLEKIRESADKNKKIRGPHRKQDTSAQPSPPKAPDIFPKPPINERPIEKKEWHLDLRHYQKKAFEEWKGNDYQGIIALATGTGKTITALEALIRFKENNPHGFIFIVVPSQPLAVQWRDDIHDLEKSLITIDGFDSKDKWFNKLGNLINQSKINKINNAPITIAIRKTFNSDEFQDYLRQLNDCKEKNHFIIVDECHRYNGPEQIKYLPENIKIRMGLSATPYDQFEGEQEDKYLDKYFKKVVHTYSIADGIREKYLTQYEYYVIETYMNEKEMEKYFELSEQIRKMQNADDPEMKKNRDIKLFERSRLVGSIEDKLEKLKDLIQEKGKNTLVYCGDAKDETGLKQIENVTNIFNKKGWNTGKITADEDAEERKTTINNLQDGMIDAIISIRVLDEGVNIPSVEEAYILASRRSEREYIQRRGRVLRTYKGKDKAKIYDFVVMGSLTNKDNFKNLHKAEFERVLKFANDAINKNEILIKYEKYFRLLETKDG